MAAVSFQPIPFTAQDALDQPLQRQNGQVAAANTQAVAAPNDTVNVSSLAVAAAQAGQGAGHLGADFVATGASISRFAGSGPAAAGIVSTTAQAPGASAATGASQTPAAETAAASTQQQQELAQLDQLLASLGIDPQSIPTFNQVALLRYLNDPSGLQRFIEQLQALTPFQSTVTGEQNSVAQNATSSPGQAVDVKV